MSMLYIRTELKLTKWRSHCLLIIEDMMASFDFTLIGHLYISNNDDLPYLQGIISHVSQLYHLKSHINLHWFSSTFLLIFKVDLFYLDSLVHIIIGSPWTLWYLSLKCIGDVIAYNVSIKVVWRLSIII